MSDDRGLPEGERNPPQIRIDVPHPGRMYDYWLGGKDNFAADREHAEQALEMLPQVHDNVHANRRFMARATRFLCDAGIRQFLDLGAGLPNSPNVHEIAQQADPDARVVYVDNDPVVHSHAAALMARGPRMAAMLADLRDAEDVLRRAVNVLDFAKPVALMFVSCLHNVDDKDDPAGIVARYLEAAAPGSYLALSHCTDEFAYEEMHKSANDLRERGGGPFVPRGKDDILRMFNGGKLVDPGLVRVSYWRPEGGEPGPNADRVMLYGGIAATS